MDPSVCSPFSTGKGAPPPLGTGPPDATVRGKAEDNGVSAGALGCGWVWRLFGVRGYLLSQLEERDSELGDREGQW